MTIQKFSLEVINLPAKIQILTNKQPCKKALVEFDEKEKKDVLKWEPGKSAAIEPHEMDNFVKDTSVFILAFGTRFLDLLKGPPSRIIKDYIENTEGAVRYWLKWGPLFPTPRKEKENDVLDLYRSCWASLFAIVMWEPVAYQTTPIVDNFFNIVKKNTDIFKKNNELPPKYWHMTPIFHKEEPLKFPFIPTQKRIRASMESFDLLIKQPPENILSSSCPRETRIAWLRESVMESIADYINRQHIRFNATVKGNEIHLIAETNNLFLSYLMNGLLNIKEIEYCKCGCGRPIPPGRRDYATDECKERNPKRKIKKWLNSKRYRKHITGAQYEKLCQASEDMFSQGFAEQQVRDHIENLIEGRS